ncbi:MAG: 50S ribosomal protein L21 [Dehalococcoidales bacterium]|nr:50S ribosomal protein L21 [Dehalococcoidales bacterium]
MEGTNIYAIIETGGKQYRVTQGQTVDVDNMNVIEGDAVELDKVLVIGTDNGTTIGAPMVEGAKVMATSKGTVRGDKIIVYKFKSKVRYRKKTGHHQLFTRLSIDKIEAPGVAQEEPVKKEEAASGS